MFYEDEPYGYYEPSVADELLMEFQQKMKDVLLDSIKNEINQIKAENESLKSQNNCLLEEVSKIKQKERDLEIRKSNLEREVRRERLSKLMEDFQVVMYRVDSTYEKSPKCDKCDDNRNIEFVSPLGKSMKESCSCNVGKDVYTPQEYICTEFKINRDNNNSLSAWYKEHHERDYDWYGYQSSSILNTVYREGMNYAELNRYDVYFQSKEECQKYCDWLNINKKDDEEDDKDEDWK